MFDLITIIHPSMHFIGGAERLMMDLALGLDEEGITIEFVTGILHRFWREELSKMENNIKIKEIGRALQGNMAFWIGVKRFARELSRLIDPKTNVILTSGFPSSLAAEMFDKRRDVKVLHYLHEAPMVLHDRWGIKELPLRFRIFYRLASALYAEDDLKAVRGSDLMVANSRLTRRANAEAYGVEESKIKVVYPGVNLERIAPVSTAPEIVRKYVGRIPIIFFPKGTQLWMNQEFCLQALKRYRSGDYLAVFTGGSRYEASRLFRRSRALGLDDKVLWRGELTEPELRSMYSHSSLVVSLPKRQPFGLAPLEALACGAPPIVSISSGVAEILRDGVDVICIHGDDPMELAGSIEMLIEDDETRSKIVHNGRYRVITELNSKRFVKEIKDVLSDLEF